jgi:SAM-dependent methyltransferase
MLHGSFLHPASFQLSAFNLKIQIYDWIAGSLVLGPVLGMIGGSAAALFVYSRSSHGTDQENAALRFVRKLFRSSPMFARGFVKWKLRLDRIFGILLKEDAGSKSIVDLGCGYGVALAIAAFRNPEASLIGCDLDPDRIRIGNCALRPFNAQLFVEDIRTFQFADVDLIMIIDVLQYLEPQDQRAILNRCCEALNPEGKLIFRVTDRENGVLSVLTTALDRVIFRIAGIQKKPVVLPHDEYGKILNGCGVSFQRQRLHSRLPLTHVVYTAKKPADTGECNAMEQLPS